MQKNIPLSYIKPNPANPRVIKDDKFQKLVDSIKAFPKMLEKRPIVIESWTNPVTLGGNMRLRALEAAGYTEIPRAWVTTAEGWTEEERKQFIIKDNVGYGEWDWDMLANEWDAEKLEQWGLDLPEFSNPDDFSEGFSLPSGEKEPFTQMTFTLADQQAQELKDAIEKIKKSEDFKRMETHENENSNGNALYLLLLQWAELRK